MKLTSIIMLLFCLSNYLYGQQYKIPSSVFGSGGGFITGSNFQVNSTAGQTLIGLTEGGNYKKQVGFWYQLEGVNSVEEIIGEIPTEYYLVQNYPNPFNPSTTIRFALKERSKVELVVFNLLGQSVATLVNEELDAGWYETNWNADNLASGVYVYRIIANQFVQSRKMLLLR